LQLLFRPTVAAARARKLHGAVLLLQPRRLLPAVLGASAVTAALVAGLATATVPRKETLPGWVTTAGGVAAVGAPAGMTAQAVSVEVGQEVAA
jgi:hypothetical protein